MDNSDTEDTLNRVLRAELRVTAVPDGLEHRGRAPRDESETWQKWSGRKEFREEEERSGARADAATFFATTPAVTLLGSPLGGRYG